MIETRTGGGLRLSRRTLLAGAAAGTLVTPALAQNALKGTKLTVLVGQFYVPENNTQIDQLGKDLAQETGMDVHVERYAGDELGTKTASVIGSGRGADISVGVEFDTYLYAPKLADVTELADDIGKRYGGWFDVAKEACFVDGKWKSLCIGQAPAAWNYRVDQFHDAGIDTFPDTFDDLLKAAKALHAKGTPIGMTLGHASGDARSTNYPVLWAFGGKEFEADGKTVALDSPQTLQAVEWYTEIYPYFVPGTTAWLDPDNNQAFLSGKCSATVNVNTIYLAARAAAATNPVMKNIAENMNHGNWPKGPAGRFANYNINVWLPFASSQNRAGQIAWLKAFYDPKFLIPWTKTGQSYFIPTFTGFEHED
ncbi:MAG TPA: ABC transporter substrate-binding protein, partial [Acetobacteraceae bacterium]|nr:ABC transporter substrate-binding protein [Acetobacteraceae bacterium]